MKVKTDVTHKIQVIHCKFKKKKKKEKKRNAKKMVNIFDSNNSSFKMIVFIWIIQPKEYELSHY